MIVVLKASSIRVGNESLKFESRVIDVESRVVLSHFVQTTRLKSCLFLPRLESFRYLLPGFSFL